MKSENDISKYFELQIKESSDENRNLIREVFNHTPSPQYIRGITTSFAGDVIGGRFVAIEWNFGEEDWLHECLDLHNLDQDHVERCKKLRIAKKSTNLNNDYKADIFASFISLLPVRTNQHFRFRPKLPTEIDFQGNDTAIYVPITDLSHYEKFKELEEKLVHSGYEIYNRDDLGDYLEFHFGDCQENFEKNLKSNHGSILSMIAYHGRTGPKLSWSGLARISLVRWSKILKIFHDGRSLYF